ncbi:MAG: hypothetical protein AB9836_02710 [Aminipila sp.]
MKKYKYKLKMHIVNSMSILFIVVLFFFEHIGERRNSDYLLSVFAAIALFNFVNTLFTFYRFNGDSLLLQSITKKIIINLNEVECIVCLPIRKFMGSSIRVYSKGKTITITSWTNKYVELLNLIVTRYISIQYDNIDNVDVNVLQLIKYKD